MEQNYFSLSGIPSEKLVRVSQSFTWMALCEQECAGTIFTELQEEESVWAEPVDEGLLC